MKYCRSTTIQLLVAIGLASHVCYGINFGSMMGGNSKNAQPHDYMDDASTGTITQLSQKQEDAMSCDAIMAKSLVKANEAKAVAEEAYHSVLQKFEDATIRIAELEKDLAEALTTIDENKKQAEETIAQVKKDAATDIEKIIFDSAEQIKAAQEKMKASQDDAKAQIETIKLESAEKIEAIQIQMKATEKKAEDDIIEIQLESSEQIQAMKKEMKIAQEKANDQVANIQKESDNRIQEVVELAEKEKLKANEDLKNAKAHLKQQEMLFESDAMEKIGKFELDANQKISDAESERDLRIAEMKASMIVEKDLAKSMLAKADRKAEQDIEKLEKTHKEELLARDAEKAAVEEKMNSVTGTMKSEATLMKKRISELELSLTQAQKDLVDWESLHSSRSYCNVTHMGEDTYKAAQVAAKLAGERADVAKKQARVLARQASEKAFVVAQPHLKKSRELYNQHVKESVDKHILPRYKSSVKPVVDAHVWPWVPVLQSNLENAIEKVHIVMQKTHAKIAKEFESACPPIIGKMKAINKDHDGIIPDLVIDKTKEACSAPEESVTYFLWFSLCVFAFIFRSRVMRTFKYIILLPFRIIWFFTPLRFLLPKRRPADPDTSHTRRVNGAGPVIKKEKKTGPPQ
mmetsp:Transcript_4973/g.7537  ORF Transcript_4973/g.7537 Transcript_4973/m.7537 type:complete len:633 (-) Transcript_4973:108-2006(-)